jgi:hypothetical protein
MAASHSPTVWAVGSISPKCTNCFTIDNSGNLKGDTGAAAVTSRTYTVTVVASNAAGASAAQAQTVVASYPVGRTVYLSAVNTLNGLAGSTIPNGGSAVLTWDSSAGSCTGTGFTASAAFGTATVSPSTTTTYSVNCGGATASATVTVSGTLRQPATDGTCAANGGGSGTSASPWRYNCIQAAVNAASAGDTILLAGGNWRLDTADATFVGIDKAGLTLVGAGSGNTVDAYGHINNAAGTTQCPTAGTSITCIYQTGTSHAASSPVPGGIIVVGQINCVVPFACPVQAFSDTNCANETFTHIFFDGSAATAGGDYAGLLSINNCAGPITLADIRFLTANSHLTGGTETQLAPSGTQDILIRDSMMANPLVSGNYSWGQALESVLDLRETLINNYFWQGAYNPTDNDSVVYKGNYTDVSLINNAVNQGAMGPTGCSIGPSASPCVTNSSLDGTFHFTTSNNYFTGGTGMFALGGSINDPSTNGNINDLHFTGNWLYGADVALDACIWHLSSAQGNCAGGGMSINAQADAGCNLSSNSQPYLNTNNSLIGTASAHLNAAASGGTMLCYDVANPSGTPITIKVFNYTAQTNYLSSPSNQYNTNSNSFSPTVTGNFCSGSSFTQTDSSTCATTGFTTPPSVSFALGTLSNGIVQFSSTSFGAQYGAVKWLASTSSVTPTPSDSRWSFTPPVSLAMSHGDTVYMWVMDSVCVTAPGSCTASQHVSAAASQSIIVGGTCPADDGSAGAPTGTPPYPTALSGYTTTIHALGCKVAGMDYNVGATGTLTAYTGQTISGWNYNAGASAYLETTADNPAVLQNWDFSGIANFQLRIKHANVTVSNNFFQVNMGASVCTGTNTPPVCQYPVALSVSGSQGTNVTFTKNTIDGQNIVMGSGELIDLGNNPGTTVITYNWLKNTYSQHIADGAGTGSVTAKYNLFDQATSQAGAHSDWYEGCACTLTMNGWVFNFNTAYQHGTTGNGTQGFMFEPSNGATISNLTAQYNTMIAVGTSANLVNFFFGLGSPGNYTVTNANFNNNYIDPTGISSALGSVFIRSQVTGSHGANNINMVSGGAMAGSTW